MPVNYKHRAERAEEGGPQSIKRRNPWLVVFTLLLVGSSGAAGQVRKSNGGGSEARLALDQKLAAAGAGDVEAQLQVGKMYFQGKLGREQRVEGVRWLQVASEHGSTEASAWLGACYLLGRGVEKNEDKARSLLEAAAGKGDAVGLRFMGVWFERKQDYGKAAAYYTQAIQHGDSNALVRMAHLQAHGLGLSKDKKKAQALLVQAAGQGGEWAQLRLGRAYELGDSKAGVARDPGLAIKFYSQAALQGNRIAAYRLGQIYSSGIGTAVAKDPKKALESYKQSALQGYAPAQYELARMREQGKDVELSLVAAYYWYSMAARRNHEQASERLLDLRGRMDAGQIRKAEELLQKHDALRHNPPKL